ncbi:hypothetical protein KM043_017405 [Ampulex compressa]|nr:hypothetical protein KM043_017405 [Ampulex compressa]
MERAWRRGDYGHDLVSQGGSPGARFDGAKEEGSGGERKDAQRWRSPRDSPRDIGLPLPPWRYCERFYPISLQAVFLLRLRGARDRIELNDDRCLAQICLRGSWKTDGGIGFSKGRSGPPA